MQRLPPRFRSLQFFLCKIYGQLPHLKRLVWRRHAARKPTETSVTEFATQAWETEQYFNSTLSNTV